MPPFAAAQGKMIHIFATVRNANANTVPCGRTRCNNGCEAATDDRTGGILEADYITETATRVFRSTDEAIEFFLSKEYIPSHPTGRLFD